MVDTHAHLNFEAFKNDYAEAMRRSFDNGVEKIINVGSQFATSRRAVEISGEFENAYAAVGLHPIHVLDEDFDLEKFRALAKNKKVVAIGETGLDYFHLPQEHQPEFLKKQKELFLQHIELARELNLSLIMHCRGSKENPKDAYEEIIEILQGFLGSPPSSRRGGTSADAQFRGPAKAGAKLAGVIHCFSADWAIAQKFLELGFYIGFTGNITFPPKKSDPQSGQLAEVVKNAPLDRILTETDCPYLAPQPVRGQRNEPQYVKFVLEKIAEVKELTFAEVEKITVQNAEELFGI